MHIIQMKVLKINFVMAHSKKTHAATEVNVTIKAPSPNTNNETRKAGINAIKTPYILF